MLCIVLCFALGIANIFNANWVIAFSIVCLYVSRGLLPDKTTSNQLAEYVRSSSSSSKSRATSLIVAAVFLLLAAVFYALAGFKGQQFQGSKTLGGQGVAQMII